MQPCKFDAIMAIAPGCKVSANLFFCPVLYRDKTQNESSEQRQERLAKKRAYMKDKRKNESLEEKETYRKLLKETKGSSTNRG